ncbi:MAG: hypothetical protein U0441_07905 [Polyangiaceae bacterium]
MKGFLALATALSGASAGCRSAVSDFYDPLDGSGTTTGTTTSTLPSDCQGDPAADASIVRDDCGLFVNAAAATNGDGTKAAPFRTIADAAAKGPARIFVCAGDYTEVTTLELAGGMEVFGGFGACPKSGDWTWAADKRASVLGPANLAVVHVSSGSDAACVLHAVNVSAPDATEDGASSIGILADGVTLSLVDVAITTGAGVNGTDGQPSSLDALPGAPGLVASATDACVLVPMGGVPGSVTCDDGITMGGDGGAGGPPPASNGSAGVDGTPMDNTGGLGGAVDVATGQCTMGGVGHDGAPGDAGGGGNDIGTLTSNGISGGDGTDGKNGQLGQGGGGGGGAKAGTFCKNGVNTVAGPGASGGGGGSGGCGGKGGGGGKVGGSSVGIVSKASTLTFAGVTITTGAGGDGGAGAPGKAGGAGGPGGAGGVSSGLAGSKQGCSGGAGGQGGDGGWGGGGRGGHSLGIAFVGMAPTVDKEITITPGAPGDGGKSDPSDSGNGSPGTSAPVLSFD